VVGDEQTTEAWHGDRALHHSRDGGRGGGGLLSPVPTWREDKDALARKRQQRRGMDSGLIGVWSCLESWWPYRAAYDARAGYPQLHRYRPHCKHLYLYFDHSDYGWMNVHVQTWFPYHIQVALGDVCEEESGSTGATLSSTKAFCARRGALKASYCSAIVMRRAVCRLC